MTDLNKPDAPAVPRTDSGALDHAAVADALERDSVAAPAGPTTDGTGFAGGARAASGDPVYVGYQELNNNILLSHGLVQELVGAMDEYRATVDKQARKGGRLTNNQRLLALVAIWVPALALVALSLVLGSYEVLVTFLAILGAVNAMKVVMQK